jgi:hypothetical protein
MLQGIKTTKTGIEIDGKSYKHYSYMGKNTATEWVVWDGIHYYNSQQPLNASEQ